MTTITVMKSNFFLFLKLPAAFWCGVRIRSITNHMATVSISRSWFNSNPFRSIYFAALEMAAELSTGLLVRQAIISSKSPISMLVASNKSVYLKKAVGNIQFTCAEGEKVNESVALAVQSGEGVNFTLRSEGKNEQGEVVAMMAFEWTVKVKKQR